MLLAVDELMPIGEFSRESGLSTKQLRSYAATGLLAPAAVDSATGYRYYSPGQVRTARLIDALRRGGMPVADIAAVLPSQSVDSVNRWARRLEVYAVQRHAALDEARRLLDGHSQPNRRDTMTSLNGFARTDIGRVRDNNEDATLCRDDLLAVADGMGGAPGGEVASAVAIALLDAAFTGRSRDELEAGNRAANRAIFERAAGSSELAGMGTTLCAVGLISDSQIAVCNVGDSRAYLLHGEVVTQLTSDHTVAAELLRRGELTEDEAREHPRRNVLTRVLGVGPTVDGDCSVHNVNAGDRLLLCTDGLFTELTDADLQRLLAGAEDAAATATALVEGALSNGGADNISVVVADVVG